MEKDAVVSIMISSKKVLKAVCFLLLLKFPTCFVCEASEQLAVGSTSLEELEGSCTSVLMGGHFVEFICELEGAAVYEEGRVLTKDREIFEDTTIRAWGKEIEELSVFRTSFDEVIFKKISGTLAVVASVGAENPFHWFFQVLPRIAILQKSALKYDKTYINECIHPYQKESLAALGILEQDLIFAEKDTLFQADKLIVPSIPVWPAKGKFFDPWIFDFINNLFKEKSFVATSKRIFISREKAKSRHVVNEQELLSELARYKFERVFLEDLTVLEQVQLARNAEFIIGAHGSGLYVWAFAKPGTHVVEINSALGHRGPYRQLAQSRGLHYEMIDAVLASELEDSMIVPVEELVELVKISLLIGKGKDEL